MWAVVGVVPVVAVGAAYAMGAFGTNISSLNKSLSPEYSSSAFARNPKAMESALEEERTAFRGDTYEGGRRTKKTKKSKSKHKKTKRRA